MFGFLFLVFLILIITCSETTVLLCYFHLCAEDYNWWWRSFLTSGFTAIYLFLYCIHYFNSRLNIEDAASTFLYFGYTIIVVFLFFLMTGKSVPRYTAATISRNQLILIRLRVFYALRVVRGASMLVECKKVDLKEYLNLS